MYNVCNSFKSEHSMDGNPIRPWAARERPQDAGCSAGWLYQSIAAGLAISTATSTTAAVVTSVQTGELAN